MRKIINTITAVFSNRNTWSALALIGLFSVLTAFVPFRTLIEYLNWINLAVAVAVTIAYAPYAGRFFLGRRVDNIMQLTLGIAMSWISVAVLRAWVLSWRSAGQPDWMADSRFIAFPVFVAIVAGALHLTAPGAVAGIVPRKNWVVLGVTVGAGILLAAVAGLFGVTL